MTQIDPFVSSVYSSGIAPVKTPVVTIRQDPELAPESDSIVFSAESLALAESALAGLPPDDLPSDGDLDDLVGDDPISPYP